MLIEEMSIFGNSSHLEWRAGLSDVSDSSALHSRWLLLLKINISSISIAA
jgi:hypothetical protein